MGTAVEGKIQRSPLGLTCEFCADQIGTSGAEPDRGLHRSSDSGRRLRPLLCLVVRA
jgi:hypothetical protein